MRRIAKGERVKLPRINRIRKGGKVYKYHRLTKAPLPADVPEDHPSFIAAWTRAEAGKRPEPNRPGSIAAAISAWLRSESVASVSPSYRGILHRHAGSIREAWGPAQLRHLRDDHIQGDLLDLPAHPARQRLKAWRHFLKYAEAAGFISADPSAGIKPPKAAQSDGHEPWTRDDVEQVREHWPVDHPRRLGIELLFWTGARVADAVTLGQGMVRSDGLLTFQQSKTKAMAYVPWTSDLPAFCDPRDHEYLMACVEAQGPSLLFLVTQTGKPRTVKGASNWIKGTALSAGVTKTAHGLRKARLIDLAERGAQALAIQAWGGHKTLSEVQHYITAAERRKALIGTEQDRNSANRSELSKNRPASI